MLACQKRKVSLEARDQFLFSSVVQLEAGKGGTEGSDGLNSAAHLKVLGYN